jgi:hypothetical protein
MAKDSKLALFNFAMSPLSLQQAEIATIKLFRSELTDWKSLHAAIDAV